jgi:hypothetical protein
MWEREAGCPGASLIAGLFYAQKVTWNQYPHDHEMWSRLTLTKTASIFPKYWEAIMEFLPAIGSPLPAIDIFVPTGFGHIDDFIKGQLPGDCIGLLGVLNDAKITQLIDLAVQNAKNFHRAGVETGTHPKLSVFMSYEQPESLIEKRIWANATQIPLSKLSQLTDRSGLTTQANLEPYELELASQASMNLVVPSESERWGMAQVWLNQSFRLLDMTGSRKHPGAGAGHVDEVDEIVTHLERLCTEADAEIGSVQIDDAQQLYARYMNAKKIGPVKLRYYLDGIADKLRRRIARRFKCAVWLGHHSAVKTNKRPPTELVHLWEAAASKAFAEHLDACGCFGVVDPVTGCVLLNWSKPRDYQVSRQPTPVLQVDSKFCRMIDVTDRYVPNSLTHSFIERR